MAQPKVDILLSTWNGEKFLACQLDSLLAQDYPALRVLVRDDGSTDGTVGIIRKYAAADSRIVFVNDPGDGRARNLGYRDSFMELLSREDDAEYYAFCDQDDFWFPEKVRLGVEALEAVGEGRPALYSSSFDYCDEALNRTSAPPMPRGRNTLRRTLFYSTAFGFTAMLNRALRSRILEFAPKCPALPHDHLCEQLACIYGEHVRDARKTALYRRHAGAVTASFGGAAKLAAGWVRNDLLGSTMATYRKYSRQLLAAIPGDSPEEREARRLLELFGRGRFNPASWLGRVFYPWRLRPTIPGEIALRLALALRP